MKRVQIVLAYLVLIVVALAATSAYAENEGRSDLDKATQKKLIARSLPDLEAVVELCESALKKGLDQGNTQFAEQLLSSTLYEYSNRISQLIFNAKPPNPPGPILDR